MRKCIAKVPGAGNFNTTHMVISPDGSMIATGSKMGVVNFYSVDAQTHLIQNEPVKSVMNLTTAITDLKFNSTSQLLAVCSKWKKNAVRLVHIPSYTVYQNFPGGGLGMLKYPFCVDFSSTSEFFGLGNDQGAASLYHLNHFAEE